MTTKTEITGAIASRPFPAVSSSPGPATVIQAKLAVAAPEDPAEMEADAAAEAALQGRRAVIGAAGGNLPIRRYPDGTIGSPPKSYPGRALRNAFSTHWNGREEALAAEQKRQEEAYLATASDDFGTRVVWAGEGVDLIKDVPAASEIIERVVAQAAEILTRGATLVRSAPQAA